MHKVIKAGLILIVVSILVAFTRDAQLNQQQLELKQIEIKDTSLELKQLNEKYEQELQKSDTNQKTIDQLNKEKEELNKQLQAKREAQAKVAQQQVQPSRVAQAAPQTAPQGSCSDWMAQAGITDPATAYWLIMKESGCRPTAQNPTSTAYGVMQFLDSTWRGAGCVKTSDPVQQMRCGQTYVMNRYGSWANAKAFWLTNRWY